ncbi:hypothetical protein BGZ99_009175 [Dissophora globulifera]|uniref:Atos-like conserved domain-containing protein n=1 Tax=Dissophora globulifera TaxID=979702 RepID=A0A9P6UYS8_9FUNG|nr:hypothetical protein BGZ99_009175 [Dissophora globulifera]
MPTPNSVFSALQPSAVFPGTSAADMRPLCEQGASTRSFQDHQQYQQQLQQQQQQQQQHHHDALHEQRQTYSPYQHLQSTGNGGSSSSSSNGTITSSSNGHSPGHNHNRAHSHTHTSSQPGPDPAVMEFISKIGQIIVKARTVSPTLPFNRTTISDAGTGTGVPSNAIDSSSSNHSSLLQQQNLEMVLQDLDLWRNSTPVHVNILHEAQHVLLERWVISYTPASSPAASPAATATESARGATSPFHGYLSPKARHLQAQSPRSPSSSPSMSTSAAAHPKDTTDLVLLLQSLYTQIRSLPLQNCLTSFDDQTKLAKTDLAYSVTSAHEDITQSRQDRAFYSNTHGDAGDAPITDPSEDRYDSFTSSLKSTLPLEFVNSASLKVINYEASHVQWGCVRVTGMYDESVGGRIAPEDFQDSTKVQKKRHHRSKGSGSTHGSDSSSKAAKRQQKDTGTWAAISQPVKADTAVKNSQSTAPSGLPQTPNTLAVDKNADSVNENTPKLSPHSFIPQERSRDLHETPLASEDEFHSRVQSFKQSNGGLFSSLSSARAQPSAAVIVVDERQNESYKSVLQESLLKQDADGETPTHNQERMQAYQFPPPPSPPLSIPISRKTTGEQCTPSSSSQVATPTDTGFAPSYHQKQPSFFQHSPPVFQQHFHHSHVPFSTSPLAHVITRRRSSRLSIVMTCNDDSPDTTRPQSPSASKDDQGVDDVHHSTSDDTSLFQSFDHFHRRGSFQDQRSSLIMDNQQSKPPLGQSPTRQTFLRRSSLTPSSLPHGDLFGSLVGSYEESILSGRMSTLPSKPLIFTAQIGVLANQDYKDCPPKLRCPKHVLLEFPAVFYDYESSSSHQGGHHSHQNHHQLHHSSSTQSLHSKTASSFGHHTSFSSSHHALGSSASSPSLISYFSTSANLMGSHGPGPSSAHSFLTTQDDPILPYVGNLDLDNGLRGSRRFARMPGGMRIPLRGQVQVMIKNPNKTVVKVFLVPYDFTDMPAGTKTFLRQKSYSTCPGMGPSSLSNGNNGGTLRYAIHLQFCSPAPGYVYLYRSIRVVFANRVPDGKESLRVVLEGLGLGSRTISHGMHQESSTHTTTDRHGQTQTTPRNLEERYVKMRKGEVSFSSSKRKMEQNSAMSLSMDGDLVMSPTTGSSSHMYGLGLSKDFSSSEHGLGSRDLASPPPLSSSSSYRSPQRLNFDGQPFDFSDRESGMTMDLDRNPGTSSYHSTTGSTRSGVSIPLSPIAGGGGARDSVMQDDGDGYRTVASNARNGYTSTLASTKILSPKAGDGSGSSTMSSPVLRQLGYFPKESPVYFGSGSGGHKDNSKMLGI